MFAASVAGRKLPPEARKDPSIEPWLNPNGSPSKVTLLHLTYASQGQDTAAKMFDYSARSISERWAAGHRDMTAGLIALQGAEAEPGDSSFAAFRFDGHQLTRYPQTSQ